MGFMGYSMGASGTLRDPLDATRDSDGDASDEISDVSSSDGHTENADKESPSSVGRPASKKSELQLNQFETPLGLDPTSTPDFVQHVASFKAHLDLVHDAVKKCALLNSVQLQAVLNGLQMLLLHSLRM